MQIESLAISDVKLVTPEKFSDARGWFSETWNRHAFAAAGIDADFVQDNQSFSAHKGTVRGLHFQIPPFAQAKLVRVLRGAILDVALDIRAGSPTFAGHVSALLSAENGAQIFIPAGFAHGFVTLEPETEVLYKVDRDYSPAYERGVLWSDPDLGIDWKLDPAQAIVSDKDMQLSRLSELPRFFGYPAGGSR